MRSFVAYSLPDLECIDLHMDDECPHIFYFGNFHSRDEVDFQSIALVDGNLNIDRNKLLVQSLTYMV